MIFHAKRLEKGYFKWPDDDGEATLPLTFEELSILLCGTKIELKLSRREVTKRRVV